MKLTPQTAAAAFARKYGGVAEGAVVIFRDARVLDLRNLLVEHGYTRVKDEAGIHFERTIFGITFILLVDRATHGVPAIEFLDAGKGASRGKTSKESPTL